MFFYFIVIKQLIILVLTIMILFPIESLCYRLSYCYFCYYTNLLISMLPKYEKHSLETKFF